MNTEFIRGVVRSGGKLFILLDADRILNWNEQVALAAEL